MRSPLTPEQQADLRKNGLLADSHEQYTAPQGIRLDALPRTLKAKRRLRSDRVTNWEAERLGITKKKRGGK